MNSLAKVVAAMRAHEAVTFYFKRLAANDNSKNQIYLGPGFMALNLLPAGPAIAVPSGRSGREVFRAAVPLGWLASDGSVEPAHESKLILYPQYPEVRLSGFLRGCSAAPSALLLGRGDGRVLLLAVTKHGQVIAFASGPEHPVTRELQFDSCPKCTHLMFLFPGRKETLM